MNDCLDYAGRAAEQMVMGNYSDEVTILGTAGQIGLGLLGWDAAMDIRDITYDFQRWEWSWGHAGQTLLDIVALIPLVGSLKYSDEFFALIKGANKSGDVSKGANKSVDIIKGTSKAIPDLIPNNGFSKFIDLKKYLGSPGEGKQWHHFVEQSQVGKRANFASEQVNSVKNIVSVPSGAGSIHSKISGYFSSKPAFTNGLTVRDWLATKSYDFQFEFGLNKLKEFGEVIATPQG